MLDRLTMEHTMAAMGDDRHGWLKRYKSSGSVLKRVTEAGEVDYLATSHAPTGYSWPFGSLHRFRPAPGHDAVLNFGFYLGQPIGYYGTEYTWSTETETYVIGQPSGAWLYRDPVGDVWRVLTGRRTVPVDDRRSVWIFEPFGVFDLDNPMPNQDMPHAGFIVYLADADFGADFWVESMSEDGGLVTGYVADVADYTSRKSITVSGTPGQAGFAVTAANVYSEPYNVWVTLADNADADNPVLNKYRWRGDTVIVSGAAVGVKETISVSVSGNAQTITVTNSGAAPVTCVQSAEHVFLAGSESWAYPASVTVTDSFTVTDATEIESPPGSGIWSWSLTVQVVREYDLSFTVCPGASNLYSDSGYATLTATGSGRLSEASIPYEFGVPIYVWFPLSTDRLFDAPVGAGVTRAFDALYGWQGYGGPLRGVMEICADAGGTFDKRRRGKMLAANLVLPAGDWTSGAGVHDDEFSFDPVTGTVMEEVGPLTYYWVGHV